MGLNKAAAVPATATGYRLRILAYEICTTVKICKFCETRTTGQKLQSAHKQLMLKTAVGEKEINCAYQQK